MGAAAGGARLSSLPPAAYGPAPPLCHTPAAAAAADFQPPYFPPPYPQPPLPYGQAPDATAAFPHLAGDPYGGLAPLAQPQPPPAAWTAPRAAARAHNDPPGLLAPPARALGLDPRRDYAAAVPRLLHSLADGAHGLADAPLGLPGLAAPPGLEDLQVRPELSRKGQMEGPGWREGAENGKPTSPPACRFSSMTPRMRRGSWLGRCLALKRRGLGLFAVPGWQQPSGAEPLLSFSAGPRRASMPSRVR